VRGGDNGAVALAFAEATRQQQRTFLGERLYDAPFTTTGVIKKDVFFGR
jgi:hypothetical protein